MASSMTFLVIGGHSVFEKSGRNDLFSDLLTDSDLVALFFFKNDYVYLLPTAEELRQQCDGTDQTWFVPATLQFKQASNPPPPTPLNNHKLRHYCDP